MRTTQAKTNSESTHHSLIDNKNQAFFSGRASHEPPFFSPVNIQPKLKIGEPDDKYERQADRVADAVVNTPVPNIQQQIDEEEETIQMKCKECEEERVHRKPLTKVSKKPTHSILKPFIQRKLTAQPNYHPYLLNFLPGRNPARDPASRLSPDQRITHVETLLQNLCPDFQVNASTGEVTPSDETRTPGQYAEGGNPVGCCCLNIFTRPASTNNWRILVSDVVSPHTLEEDHILVIPGPDAPISYGNWTGGTEERRVLISNEIILGHELCGHAALQELGAHPDHESRLTTNVHDPTVNIQNLIASEQGEPASDLRGLAVPDTHRGESFARIVISGYPINTISPYSIPDPSQHQKLTLATRLVQANDFFVDIIGHTDPSGDDAVNNRVSLQRANVIKSFIAGRVQVTRRLDRFDPSTPLVNRFRHIEGVRDSQPPPAAVQGNPDNWRRVEIFLASFPASSQNPPSSTPSTVTPVAPPVEALILSLFGDECEQKLVKGAYPGISVPSPVPSISPALETGIQRKCTECNMEEQENLQRKPQAVTIPSIVQRRETGEEGVNKPMASSLRSSIGSGRPLPDSTKNWMESRIGADFSRVKVHTDSRAVQLSRDLNAQAFTYGSDIYFNRGKYAPGTHEGKRLLAHELTHVVQQNSIPIIQKQEIEIPSPDAEDDSFEFDFTILPPELQFTIGNWMLEANTGSTELQFTQGLFEYSLGYSYGSEIFGEISSPGLNTRLGVNPGTGAASLGFNILDQYRLRGTFNPMEGSGGVSLGYGSSLLPMPFALRESVMGGWSGVTSIYGGLGSMGDPLSFYQAHSNDFNAVMNSVKQIQTVSDEDNQGFGAGISLTYNPETKVLVHAGMQWIF